MIRGSSNRSIVLVTLLSTWSLSSCALTAADFEVESFTRYQVDNFDNNNNGYVDDIDDTLIDNRVENSIVATELNKTHKWEYSSAPTNSPVRNNNISTGSGSLADNINGAGYFDAPSQNYFSSGGFTPDYDDLVQLSTSPQYLKGNSYLQSRSVQVERAIRFSPKIVDVQTGQFKPSNSYWELYGGARFFQFDDRYAVNGSGGILGEMFVTSQIDNQTAGPHCGFHWNLETEGWQIGMGGLLQGGVYLTEASQRSSIGEDLIPGQLNRPLYLQPQQATQQEDDDSTTLYGQLKTQASRPLTEWVTLHFGCSYYYFGDIRYAIDSINWRLPNFGIVNNGSDKQTVTTAFASLEFRR